MKEECEKEVNRLKAINTEKEEQMEQLQKQHEKKIQVMKEEFEKEIKQVEKEKTEKEEQMIKDQKGEIKKLSLEYEERIAKNIETSAENENTLKNKIETKEMLIEYVIDVLANNDKLLDFWQNTVKKQGQEINESEKKIEECRKIEKIAFESQKTLKKQENAIEKLENIIVNNQNHSESYRYLAQKDLTKTNCEISSWVNSLTAALETQNNQLAEQSEYFKNKNEIKEHVTTIETLLSRYNISQPPADEQLLSQYHDLLEQQSSSISLLRKIMTNSSTGLHFEEDNDGKLISATPCSCLPSPPSFSGLEVRSIKMKCSGNTRSSYEVECSSKDCHTDSWPTCEGKTLQDITK